MKNLTTFLATIVLASNIHAQGRMSNNWKETNAPVKRDIVVTRDKSSNSTSRWYNMAEALTDQGLITINWVYPIHPDTNTRINSSSTLYPCELVASGQVFDPTSWTWSDNQGDYSISEKTDYNLDSIVMPYAYFRPQNGNPDTLLIQVYKSNALSYVLMTASVFSQAYCTADYDSIKDEGIGAAKEFRIILDNSKVTQAGQWSTIVLNVDLPISAGEEVAMSFHFIPGNPSNPGDTIYSTTSSTSANPGNINAFLFKGVSSSITAPENYNFSMDVLTDHGKSIYSGSWAFDFSPGIYFSSPYQSNVSFKITTVDFTGLDAPLSTSDISFFPNPTSGQLYINGISKDTYYQVFDQLGREITNGLLLRMNNEINLSHLDAGHYYLRLDGRTEVLIIQ